jgi:hypothetical protein
MPIEKHSRSFAIAEVEARLKELARKGEVSFEERTSFDGLPVLKLKRKSRLDRVVKLAKR